MPQLRPLVPPSRKATKVVFSFGALYLLMQLGSLMIFQKDVILIASVLGPEEAAAFSVIWQLFLYVNVINILIAPYLAPGFGEANAQNDVDWNRKAFKRYLICSVGFSSFVSLLIGVGYRDILDIWIRSEVLPTSDTVLWLALWTVLYAFIAPCIALLQGAGRLKRFTLFYCLAASVSLPLSVLLISDFGMHGGVMASTLSFAAILIYPLYREVAKTLGLDDQMQATVAPENVQ